jgi:hypothetical protein
MCPTLLHGLLLLLLQEQRAMGDMFCGAGTVSVATRSAGWAVSERLPHTCSTIQGCSNIRDIQGCWHLLT